ncbi:hypothetical protein ACWEPL_38645 [Nonomuraea sp. NPDC004186]
MTEIADFHGPHFEPPQASCVEVHWYRPCRRVQRIRVISHSCECNELLYELCAGGGLSFVRRTDRAKGPVRAKGIVRESEWMLTAAARNLYERILRGEAR